MRIRKNLPRLAFIALIFCAAVFIAYYVSHNVEAQDIVRRFGYAGIIGLSFFAGLNLLIPIPATTFVPVFLASELSVGGIIICLVIGTTAADLLAYAIARYGGKVMDASHMKYTQKLTRLAEKNPLLPPVVLFLWASFMPLPNELILIPLGFIGFRLKTLLLPFVAGNIVHHGILTLGIHRLLPFL